MLQTIKFIFIIIIFLYSNYCYLVTAQNTNQNLINNQPGFLVQDQNKADIINSRELLLEYIENFKLVKAHKLVLEFESKYKNSDYLAFRLYERWLLSYYIKDYQKIINEAIIYDSIFTLSHFKIMPPHDIFAKIIRFFSAENEDTLIKMLNNSDLRDEEKEFLILCFYYLLNNEDETMISQDILNDKSEKFINKYPESKFEHFIRQNIRFVIKKSKYDFGFCFYSGYNFYTGNLHNHINNSIPIGISFDISYKKLQTSIEFQTDFSAKIKNDFDYHGIWPKNLKINYYQPQVNIGYKLSENQYFRIIPFLSPSFRGYLPSALSGDINSNYEGYSIGPRFTYTLGINFDYQLSEKSGIIWDNEIKSKWYLRIQFGYCYPTLYMLDNTFSGSAIYILIGISGTRKVSKRDF